MSGLTCDCGKPYTTIHCTDLTYMFCTVCKDKERVFREVGDAERWQILNDIFRNRHDRSKCNQD